MSAAHFFAHGVKTSEPRRHADFISTHGNAPFSLTIGWDDVDQRYRHRAECRACGDSLLLPTQAAVDGSMLREFVNRHWNCRA